ncbi:conserved hypothetical protein [uncultured Mycobacterium sp.]|uniref:DUF4232 domain-containing protein n=1 Tax=uncultured Mycobacterium sp. TaxID=171292 RepID=A0A1Y5PA70_9MYCO|nr:conserved hypothetical protein [uncultured Mycobacterium sp.]SBS75675.1 conserved hypothetical protein [uncultured Mycobacterium sp.]
MAALLAVPAATPWCGADSLSLSSTPPIYPTPDPWPCIHFSVLLTNTSAQTCTLQGCPGVDLVGTTDRHLGAAPDPADPPFSGIVSASRTGGDGQPVVLMPGATASSRLGFQPKTTDIGLARLAAHHDRRDPSDSTTQPETPWPFGGFTVLLINNGTQPVVTIDALQPYA